ncbi:MAG: Sensor histidine kinase RcsC [Phycisphaerae bacterium]|nr:Sensor histidine kinase RcsC [Phycisphaerae bacterium]
MLTQLKATDEVERLQNENARLHRLVESLMNRVEQTTSSANTPFGFFQINAALAEQLAQQQAALLENRQILQDIFDAAPIGLLLFGPDLLVRHANHCAARMLGLSTQKMARKKIGEIIGCSNKLMDGGCGRSPACKECMLYCLLEQARESGQARCEHKLLLGTQPESCTPIWYALKADAVVIAGMKHVLFAIEDISTKKQAEQQMREAKDTAEETSRLKSRFLSNVSHDIRTPLNGIMGFAEAILHCSDLETARQHSQIILRESTILLMLVNDLLDLVKIESGKLVLEHVVVDLSQLLRELNQTAGMQARAKGLDFFAAMAVDMYPLIMSDPLRLRQIMLNLVSNAIKFTERGEVRVWIERVADENSLRTQFSVRDTGIGIAPDKQQIIFENFTQADVSTTRQYGGSGLGLAIVRQLVGLLGGEINVQSTPGQGSTFSFVLPIEPVNESVISASSTSASEMATTCPLHRGHILFAEDYPTNQAIARHFLEQAGHQVTVVSNGREAVEVCSKTHFDLILMDLHMPIMDGQTAATLIRQADTPNAQVPILALTASADSETQAACLNSRINGVLTKPFRRQTLLAAVAQWLERTRESDVKPSLDLEKTAGRSCGVIPPIDLSNAIQEFGGHQKVIDLLKHFLDHAAGQIQVLRTAMGTMQRDILRQIAHALKGAAATLEAAPLAQKAAELEAASAHGEQAKIGEQIEAVALELQRLTQYVEKFFNCPERC